MASSLTFISFKALLRLIRFGNLMIFGLAQYFAACFLLDRNNLFDWHLLLLSTVTILVCAAGYIINDYYDIKIDLINKPERVVIGKKIPRRIALFLHTLLSLAGAALATFLNWKIGIIIFSMSFLLWWYSNSLKRQPFIGNFTVALLIGLSIELVNVLYSKDNYLVTVYSLFAFFMTLLREIIKDMEDLKGDSSFGCKTLPIVWGFRKTKLFVYGLMLAFGVLVVVLNELLIKLPISYFIVFLFVPLGALFLLLVRADTVRDFYQLSQLCKVILLLGIISMIFVNP
jgi:4-hydroxybenzoate polyprenyltransferase